MSGDFANGIRVYDDPTWGEVIQPQGRGASGPEPPRVWCEPKTWQEAARLAAQWPEALTAWERGFLVSLVRFPRLSDKQLALLDRVVRKACGTAGVREPADQAASTRKRPRRRRKRQN